MKGLINRIKGATIGEWINFCCFLISAVLIIVGFIVPPTG